METLGDRVQDLRIFGSRARGRGRPDSDLDILVLVDDPVDRTTRNKIYDLAYDVAAEFAFLVPLAPLVMSTHKFEELNRRERRLALDIRRDGIPL